MLGTLKTFKAPWKRALDLLPPPKAASAAAADVLPKRQEPAEFAEPQRFEVR